jgi:hypothetical protein
MVNVRPFQPCDMDALHAISLATGLAGGDASSLYSDQKLMGHIYSAPYAILQPELCLVAEDEAWRVSSSAPPIRQLGKEGSSGSGGHGCANNIPRRMRHEWRNGLTISGASS